jgi:putative endonuclease
MRRELFYAYMMSNRSKTIYTGVCGSLYKRVWEHKQGTHKGFTSKYRVDRLVYFERFGYNTSAIRREKQIKGMTRIKKIALIVSMNPTWRDLSEGWYDRHPYQPENPKGTVEPAGVAPITKKNA